MASAPWRNGQASSSRSIALNGSFEHERALAVLGVDQGGAAAGRMTREVQRADQARRALDEDQRLLLIPGVVAERDRVGTGIQQLLVDRLGDAETAGGILTIDDDEVERPVPDHAGKMV
jgi:hypothetical protein